MSWSDTERKVLFQEIIKQNYDSIEKADLQQLGNCVNKSEREVKSLLDNYKQEAERQLEKNIIRLSCPAHTRPPAIEPPLNKWIWILKDTTQGSNAFYEALKLISEFENHPSPDECDGIDLKFLYNTMADLFVGDLPAELDQKHNEFLKTTFRKLRDFTINSEKNDKVEFILNITRLFPDLGKNNRNDSEINLIPGFLEYCSKTNFNPLDVPLTFLKNDVKLKKPEEFY